MTEVPPPPRRRAWKQGLGVLAVVLVFVVSVVLVNLPSGEEPTPPAGPTTSEAAPGEEPLEVSTSTTLTVPDTQRLEPQSFDADEGATYLLQFEASTTKPADSPGDAMYFGASLACGGPDDGTLRSVGGTQNVRTGETVTIRNQFLLEVDKTGRYACRLLVFSPNAEVAAAGTTASIDTRWSATRVETKAVEAPAGEQLPRIVGAHEGAAAFVQSLDRDSVESSELKILGTVHVTTCTEVEGSSEDGRTWCIEGEVDERGSDVTLTYRLETLDSAGEICDRRELQSARAQVDRHTHHQIFHGDERVRMPQDLCGDSVRLAVTVDNGGPAPLLIHRASSTLVVVHD